MYDCFKGRAHDLSLDKVYTAVQSFTVLHTASRRRLYCSSYGQLGLKEGANAYLAVRELTADFLSFRASWSWLIWMEVDLVKQKGGNEVMDA